MHYDASSCDNFKLLADVKYQQERSQKILEIRDLRLSRPADSTHRMESVCRLITTEIGEGHGYHRDCYKKVGQTDTISTFDLGVCMKALPLIWNNPDKYKNHIVIVGTFHLVCAYFKMVGKKMADSWLSDVLLEAGLIGSGSVHGYLVENIMRGLCIVIRYC